MTDRRNLRGMSDSAPLYALAILVGGMAFAAALTWGLVRMVFG